MSFVHQDEDFEQILAIGGRHSVLGRHMTGAADSDLVQAMPKPLLVVRLS